MRRNELVLQLCLKPATLELYILAAAIGQLVNPNVTIVVGAPCPGLFSGQFTMIRDVDNAPIRLFVVNAKVVTS